MEKSRALSTKTPGMFSLINAVHIIIMCTLYSLCTRNTLRIQYVCINFMIAHSHDDEHIVFPTSAVQLLTEQLNIIFSRIHTICIPYIQAHILYFMCLYIFGTCKRVFHFWFFGLCRKQFHSQIIGGSVQLHGKSLSNKKRRKTHRINSFTQRR